VILPAAGKSSRFRDQHYKKPFALLDGRPVWMHAAERFANRKDVVQSLLVIAPEDREHFTEKFGGNAALLGIEVVEGGNERYDSVARALERVKPEAEFIAVHDAARPCLVDEWIDAVFAAAVKSGAAILAAPVTGTLKRVGSDHTVAETVAREGLWEAQTPQVFRRQLLTDAYARRGSERATDDAQLVERPDRGAVVGDDLHVRDFLVDPGHAVAGGVERRSHGTEPGEERLLLLVGARGSRGLEDGRDVRPTGRAGAR
jgi:2-C-methyl-D-erythritol 4-phosphate cytidylyltransferase